MSEKTFKEAYGVLQKHAETLRNQREPNIDDLLKIVTESVDAYGVCKSRIDAVEKALEVALGPAADGEPEAGAQGGAGQQPTGQGNSGRQY
jgi:exodeoxyribonuclease VII small subunit